MSIWKKNKPLIFLYVILLLGAVHGVYGLDHRHEPALSGMYPESSFSKWHSKALENNIYENALLDTGKVHKRVYFNNNDFLWYVLVESLQGHHGQHLFTLFLEVPNINYLSTVNDSMAFLLTQCPSHKYPECQKIRALHL